jgi:hypothetical protein
MDISGSTAAGVLRVGIQILAGQRRPVLEFYHELHNIYRPEQEHTSSVSGTFKHRWHDLFLAFTLVNIGAVRAENVTLSVGGGLKRDHRPDFGGLFEGEIPQVAPGQLLYLFTFHQGEFHDYIPEPPPPGKTESTSARMAGLKKEDLILTAEYNGPWQGFNRIQRLWSWCWGKKQYRSSYTFNTRMIATDIPPAKYA